MKIFNAGYKVAVVGQQHGELNRMLNGLYKADTKSFSVGVPVLYKKVNVINATATPTREVAGCPRWSTEGKYLLLILVFIYNVNVSF